ncbi:amidohydrolase family protein [Microbacterium sp. 2FI]|uniref:amidohydrolase family protein n=1 Tax=Microbacterium sp. 2FI TaxID=2502193 RepID=UPI0010F72CE2|nr:amidohydrolase family protein [Microbacterium sp. 2FI]
MDLPFAVTTPMRGADTISPPAFAMPTGACDTHFHVFEPGYPPVGNPQYTFPDGTLDQYVAVAGTLGIDRMVLVQPTYYGENNALTLDTLARLGDRARGVARVPDDVSHDVLDDYDRQGIRAIRLDLFARREWPLADLVDYVKRMGSLARPHEWHLQFYAPGAVVHALLPLLGDLPVPYVVDHMGYMKQSDGLGDDGIDGILSALDAGNCWIKLSGAYRVAGDAPMATMIPLGRTLVSSFPDRLIWGSDWPHLPDGQRDTGEVLNLLADWAPDSRVVQRILVDSPDVLFFSH